MSLTTLLTLLYALGTAASLTTGRGDLAGAALLDGAEAAVTFCLTLGGVICLWSAVLSLLERCGLTRRLAGWLRPLLARLFPHATEESAVFEALTENVTANLLGLGNAATPAGIRAARGLAALGVQARDELGLLVVLNTASLQLVPTTVAALRASCGAASAFDILPAVWFSSLCALAAGLAAAALLRRIWK